MAQVELLPVVLKEYSSHDECTRDLLNQGCKSLGWLNSGIKLPEGFNSTSAFSTRRGTSEVYVDVIRRMFYSVDMGD